MIYLSKRDTPLVESDAACILSLRTEEYEAALADGRLRRSVHVANDPTNRLAFHNFWDLFEFNLARSADVVAETDEDRRLLAADLSDHLAVSDEDLAIGTGDDDVDLAAIVHGWTDETGVRALPAGVVNCYALLLVRTLERVHAAAETTRKRRAVPVAPAAGEMVLAA